MKNHTTLFAATLACVVHVAFMTASIAQHRGSVHFPGAMEPGSVSTAIGLSVSHLPREIVGETASHLPMLRLESRVGLPGDYSATVGLGSVYLTNTVMMGASKSFDAGDISLSAGAEVTYWFGFAKLTAFNMRADGLLVAPYVSGGLDMGICRVTLKADLIFSRATNTLLDGASIRRQRSGVTGLSLNAGIQKALTPEIECIVGVRIQYAQPDHETWLAFSNPDRWNVTPKLFIGYVL